jgi:hypothetical protein
LTTQSAGGKGLEILAVLRFVGKKGGLAGTTTGEIGDILSGKDGGLKT